MTDRAECLSPCDRHVSTPSVSPPIVRSYASGLVIDDEVTDRSLGLAKVRSWKMVPLFRQVVRDAAALCVKTAFNAFHPFSAPTTASFYHCDIRTATPMRRRCDPAWLLAFAGAWLGTVTNSIVGFLGAPL